MSHRSRRGFLGLASGAWAGAAFAAEPADADLVVLNARVHTVDDKRPLAEAFAVKGGRFTAAGTSAEIRGLIGPRARFY